PADRSDGLGVNCGALDISLPTGTPIFPIADGDVIFAGGDASSGFGLYIIVFHGQFQTYSLYAHLQEIDVKRIATPRQPAVGLEHVTIDQQIARSGDTGNSTG